jgi:hypothetical protein
MQETSSDSDRKLFTQPISGNETTLSFVQQKPFNENCDVLQLENFN